MALTIGGKDFERASATGMMKSIGIHHARQRGGARRKSGTTLRLVAELAEFGAIDAHFAIGSHPDERPCNAGTRTSSNVAFEGEKR